MRIVKSLLCVVCALVTFFSLATTACAENTAVPETEIITETQETELTMAQTEEEIFTEQDKMIFGIFPIWVFIAILAGACMLIVIVLVIIGRVRRSVK